VVLVIERASQGPNAALAADDVAMVVHAPFVRDVRTLVNSMVPVRLFCDYQAMENDKTIGQKLLELKERAGTSMPRGRMSLDEIANRIGKAGRSSVQSYFKVERTAPLAKDIAERLAHCFVSLPGKNENRRRLRPLRKVKLLGVRTKK
jgi:hypothetical protein